LLKARRDIGVQRLLDEWLAKVDVPGNVRVQVDVDPVGFL
jgi:primosomal protein N' (replication factor Y)